MTVDIVTWKAALILQASRWRWILDNAIVTLGAVKLVATGRTVAAAAYGVGTRVGRTASLPWQGRLYGPMHEAGEQQKNREHFLRVLEHQNVI